MLKMYHPKRTREEKLEKLVKDILIAYPQLDPQSEYYNNEVGGGDLTAFMSKWAEDARKVLGKGQIA
jgi:hypothetical protein